MLLEPEQRQLLVDLVEAERRVPREQRQHFTIASRIPGPGVPLIHPGWRGGRVFDGDIDTLSASGLLAKTSPGPGYVGFYVTPKGFEYYAELRRSQGAPIERVEAVIRSYLDAPGFRQRYPVAYQKWIQAEEQLWSSDSSAAFTTIGHLCREAMQEFTASLIEHFKPANVESDKTKTVARLRAVLAPRRMTLGSKEFPFLDALLAYWGTVADLVQRQEHGALREAESLTWPDARRVVFQTILVMFEIDASLVGNFRE